MKPASNLLKEYINLIIQESLNEELDEDVDIKKLTPGMLGIYAFAQAMNKLIYEGGALPGAVPIDIIDAGKKLERAPMTTYIEQKYGFSFQYTGNSFKLYINPSSNSARLLNDNETHDIIHAFTANLAKAFGRRRESVAKSKKYSLTPSKFNKITLDKEAIKIAKEYFEMHFKVPLPDEAFTKVFEFGSNDRIGYTKWFMAHIGKGHDSQRMGDIAYAIFKGIYSTDFSIGNYGRKYFARGMQKSADPKYTLGLGPVSTSKIEYKQSAEDEEIIGNVLNEKIASYLEQALTIPDYKIKHIVKSIFQEYKDNTGLTTLSPDEFKHRFDTPEVAKTLTRLLELYNMFLSRYKRANQQK